MHTNSIVLEKEIKMKMKGRLNGHNQECPERIAT